MQVNGIQDATGNFLAVLEPQVNIKNVPWTLDAIRKKWDMIDEDPPFQRGEVWKLPAKQLLIDSVFCGFDIPKVYLRDRGTQVLDRYSIADGQQRLLALMQFFANKFPTSDNSYDKNATWCGKRFSELATPLQRRYRAFKLIVALVANADQDQIREIFWRLQQGSQLNPAEKRNCMPSQIGDAIRLMAATHSFFADANCPFPAQRRNRDDLCAHAFALETYGAERDLKAPNLRALYDEFSTRVPQSLPSTVARIMGQVKEINRAVPGCIKRKWGFVDVYLYLSLSDNKAVADPDDLGRKYSEFEGLRLTHNAAPQRLLEKANPTRKDKLLYEYIEVFKGSASLAGSLEKRHKSLKAFLG
jgi:hypothetical protein